MKTAIVALLSLAALFACTQEAEQVQKLEQLTNTYDGCLKSSTETDSASYRVYALGDLIFRVDHIHASFNCCLPEGLVMEASLKGDTLFVHDYEKVPGNCRCMCTYNTSIEFRLGSTGEYVLCFMEGERKVGTVACFFDETLNASYKVSELAK